MLLSLSFLFTNLPNSQLMPVSFFSIFHQPQHSHRHEEENSEYGKEGMFIHLLLRLSIPYPANTLSDTASSPQYLRV